MSIPSETAAGRAWSEKYLHPPSVKRNGYIATPDNNMSPVCTLELDSITNISPIFYAGDTVPPTQYYSTDLFFLQSSGARVVCYVFVRSPTYLSGNWVLHPQTPAVTFDQYDFDGSWGADVQLQRLGYKSCTYYLNATQFNDQGTVTIAQFRPNIFNSNITVPPPLDTHPPLFKRMNGSNPADFNTQIIDMAHVEGGAFTGAYVPSTSTMVQQSSPKAVSHMARDGCFVPQHWSQPINTFFNQPDTADGSEYDLIQTYIRFLTGDGNSHLVPLNNAPLSSPGLLHQYSDTVWSDFTWAMVMFTGLSVPTGEGMANAPYITVKSYVGVEVQPAPKSSFVFFQAAAPIPDDKAIHAAAGVVHQKPDGYPSSANDFGSILGLVTTYVPKIVNWLSNAFSANKPTVAQVAPIVEKAVAKIEKKRPSRIPRPRTYPKIQQVKSSQRQIEASLRAFHAVKPNKNAARKYSVKQVSNANNGPNLPRGNNMMVPRLSGIREPASRVGGFGNVGNLRRALENANL